MSKNSKHIVIIASNTQYNLWAKAIDQTGLISEWESWKIAFKKSKDCAQVNENDQYLCITCSDDFKIFVIDKNSINNNQLLESIQGVIKSDFRELYIHEGHDTFREETEKPLSNNSNIKIIGKSLSIDCNEISSVQEIIIGKYTTREEGRDNNKLKEIQELINLLYNNQKKQFCEEIIKLKEIFCTAEKKTKLSELFRELYLIFLSLLIDIKGVEFCKNNKTCNIEKYIKEVKGEQNERNNLILSKIKAIRNELNDYNAEDKEFMESSINIDVGGLSNTMEQSNTNNFIENLTNYFQGKYNKTLEEYCQNLLNISMKISNDH